MAGALTGLPSTIVAPVRPPLGLLLFSRETLCEPPPGTLAFEEIVIEFAAGLTAETVAPAGIPAPRICEPIAIEENPIEFEPATVALPDIVTAFPATPVTVAPAGMPVPVTNMPTLMPAALVILMT